MLRDQQEPGNLLTIHEDKQNVSELDLLEFKQFVMFYASIHKKFQTAFNRDFTKPLERLHTALVRHYGSTLTEKALFDKAFNLMQSLVLETMLEHPEHWNCEKTSHGYEFFQEVEDDGG
jgi:hypothetical protein